jgi:hypothetical protein
VADREGLGPGEAGQFPAAPADCRPRQPFPGGDRPIAGGRPSGLGRGRGPRSGSRRGPGGRGRGRSWGRGPGGRGRGRGRGRGEAGTWRTRSIARRRGRLDLLVSEDRDGGGRPILPRRADRDPGGEDRGRGRTGKRSGNDGRSSPTARETRRRRPDAAAEGRGERWRRLRGEELNLVL